MATCATVDICDICKERHKSSLAVKWCPECEEKLCEDCNINHSVSKLLRQHTVIDIEDFRKIPGSVSAIKNFCDQHKMEYTSLCPQHDKLCCLACISGSGPHNKCTTLILREVLKSAKTPIIIQSIKESLKILKINLETIISDRQINIQQLNDQRQNIEKEIKQFKDKITNHLNVIESKIMEELNSKVNQNTTKLESEIASLELKLKKAETLLETTSALKKYGSDLQTYIGSKTMETEITRETNLLQELVNDGSLKRLEVKFVINKNERDMIEKISTVGSISVKVMPSSFVLKSDVEKQAQIISQPSILSIGDIKLTLKSKFQITCKAVYITGCSFFPSGKIIFVNNRSSNVILLKENGEIEKEISTMSIIPWDVTVIDDNTVAVSTKDDVKVINITTWTVEKNIPTGPCYGVDYYNGSVICCVDGKGVLSVDLSSSITTALVQDTRKTLCYCTVHRDKIYVSRSWYNTITCYFMKGDKLWEFKDTSVISDPRGIAVDNSSNVYVVSGGNNSIVVLSPDGKRSRTLLTEKDGMDNPGALHINKSKNQLVVVNYKGPAFLFDLQ